MNVERREHIDVYYIYITIISMMIIIQIISISIHILIIKQHKTCGIQWILVEKCLWESTQPNKTFRSMYATYTAQWGPAVTSSL